LGLSHSGRVKPLAAEDVVGDRTSTTANGNHPFDFMRLFKVRVFGLV